MTAGQPCPGADNCPSVQPHVKLTEETIQSLRQHMSEAVADGMKAVMTPENAKAIFEVGVGVMREQAKLRAGGWLFGLGSLFLRGGLLLMLATGILFAIGGWPLVSLVGKAIFGGK